MDSTISLDANRSQLIEKANKKLNKKLSPWPILIWLLLMPILLLTLTTLTVWLLNQRDSVNGELARTTEKLWYWQGQPVLVNLTPIASISGVAADIPDPADILIALDVSGSMGDFNRVGDPGYEAIKVIRKLSKVLHGAGANIGIILFESSARILAPLNAQRSRYYKLLGDASGGGGTDIGAAITLSLQEFNENASRSKKMLILVTDGYADENSTKLLANKARTEGVHIVGVGIGGAAAPFFDAALGTNQIGDAYHFSMQWNGSEREIFQDLQQILLQRSLAVLKTAGHSTQLEEYPNASALPLESKFPAELYDRIGIESIQYLDGKLLFASPYFLTTSHFYSYVLSADNIGVHPVALDKAKLAYRQSESPDLLTQVSGNSPFILVISPFLLFWLFCPALAYLAYVLTMRRRKFNLLLPSSLPASKRARAVLDAPNHLFNYRSNRLRDTDHNTDQIATMVIAVGPEAGERLAALIRAKAYAGAIESGVGSEFFPIYLDCRKFEENSLPYYRDFQLDSALLVNLYDHDRPELLANLLKELKNNPLAHEAAEWFPADEFGNNIPDVAHGCAGDRQLARLLLYLDLLRQKPRLLELRDAMEAWITSNPTGQVFCLASGSGDLGSGWIIDIAYQLRKAMINATIPIYLFQEVPIADRLNQGAHLAQNYRALNSELRTLQNASGMPFWGLNKFGTDVVTIKQRLSTRSPEAADSISEPVAPVLLPLFDRVIHLQQNSAPAESGVAAACLLELMDVQVKNHLVDGLRNSSWKFRNGQYRTLSTEQNAGSGFISVLDTSVLHAPIVIWRKIWCLQALRDFLKTSFCLDSSKDSVMVKAVNLHEEDLGSIWSQITAIPPQRPISSLAIWNEVNTAITIHGDKQILNAHEIEPGELADISVLHRELVVLLSHYLNGDPAPQDPDQLDAWRQQFSERFGKVNALLGFWSKNINGLRIRGADVKYDDLLTKIIDELLTSLADWSLALYENQAGKPTPLYFQLSNRIEQLKSQLPEKFSENGLAGLSADDWATNPARFYEEIIYPELITKGALIERFGWTTDSANLSFELVLKGSVDTRYSPADIVDGQIQENVYQMLSNDVMSEYFSWTLDDCISPPTLAESLAMPINPEGETFLFHGLQTQPMSEVVESSSVFAGARVRRHGYYDRVSYVSVKENRFEPIIDVTDPNAKNINFSQSFMSNALIMNRHSQNLTSEPLPVLEPESQLMLQSVQDLDFALLAWLAGDLQLGGSSGINKWGLNLNGVSLPLTRGGDESRSSAMRQLLFIGTSIDGTTITYQQLFSQWSAFDQSKKRTLLQNFVDEFGALCSVNEIKSGWPELLLTKARLDLQNAGGLLS